MIRVATAHGEWIAKRDLDDTGWIVTGPDADLYERRWYADKGGSWLLGDDGAVGRQTDGTRDVRAPSDARRFRSWLVALVRKTGDEIVPAPRRASGTPQANRDRRTPVVSVSLARDVLAALDGLVVARGTSRSAVVEDLVTAEQRRAERRRS